MIAEDIRTEKKYFVKVLFCNDLEQVYVEKESKVQLYSPYIIRIYGGMLDEKNKRFITLVEYIEESDLSELMRGKGITGDTWNEKMRVRNRIAMKFLYGIDHYMSMYQQDPIVHRDLKPDNLMISHYDFDNMQIKIVDFGGAKWNNPDKHADTTVVGTLGYQTPVSYTHLTLPTN